MQLTLSDEDARTLRDFLRDHLREYEFEIARTEVKDLRHLLRVRQTLLERVLGQLEREVDAQAAAVPAATR